MKSVCVCVLVCGMILNVKACYCILMYKCLLGSVADGEFVLLRVCIFLFPLLPLNKSIATELFIGSRFLQR